jgi:hypothetical protein
MEAPPSPDHDMMDQEAMVRELEREMMEQKAIKGEMLEQEAAQREMMARDRVEHEILQREMRENMFVPPPPQMVPPPTSERPQLPAGVIGSPVDRPPRLVVPMVSNVILYINIIKLYIKTI